MAGIAIWKDVESTAPELAARARAILDAHKHKTIATLRADGAPRISGIEVEFTDRDLTFGSMPGSRKGADLHRDPRFALHSASVDPVEGVSWAGDAKISGRAVFEGPLQGEAPGEKFRAEIYSVVVTGLNAAASALVIETWTPDGRVRRIERA